MLNQVNDLVTNSHKNYTQYLLSRDNSNPFIEIKDDKEVAYVDEQDEFKFLQLWNDI